MKQPPIQLLLLLLALHIHALSVQADNPDKEKKFTISGKTQDQSNGEELIGTTIFVKELKTGTISNEYGFYSLSLPAGSYTLVFSYVGYESVTRPILLTKNERLDVRLQPADKVLQEVVISSERPDQNVKSNEMSTVKMDIRTIRKIPVLMGEVDILKAVQLLPGVQSVSEGSSGFSVRGGSADQNLILLDEAIVYNASHLMGFFSVFNNDAIKDVKLYKGDIPAAYGGRLASVLDVRMKEGNNQRWNVTGGIGLIASRLTVEAPIVRDRSSFILSGRRTYMDLFTPLSKEEGLRDNKLYFYDLNAKINYRPDDANHFFLSGYFGRDVFKNDFAYMRLGNQTATLRWNRIITQKLFSNVTAIYSRYNYNLGSPEGTSSSFEWLSHLEDIGAKADFSYFLNTENTLRAGLSAIYHTFDPGMARGLGDASFFTEYRVPKSHALESAIYLSNDHVLGPRMTAKYGLRLSMFNSIGGATMYNYDEDYKPVDSTIYNSFEFFNTSVGLEPRLGLNYTLNEVSSLKASYSRTLQYLQLAQNSTAGTPLDIWFPASPNVKPQISSQVALGYFRNFHKNTFETSAEVYYKHMNH
ncbi:MAG: TonB-dependent receptor, partial [Bacteroidetes bacterium]|nr:TonB-dependent receptor [Bacteroidota bacterium]